MPAAPMPVYGWQWAVRRVKSMVFPPLFPPPKVFSRATGLRYPFLFPFVGYLSTCWLEKSQRPELHCAWAMCDVRCGMFDNLSTFFEKHIFDSLLTHFWSQNGPFSPRLGILDGPKCFKMGSKWANFTCLCTPKGQGSLLEKHFFDPFLTHLGPQKRPIFQAFWDFPKAKKRHHGLKTG